ncbi:UrcA family protein [Thermaurantiacus sp.]
MTFQTRPSFLALVAAIALTGLQTAAFAGENGLPNARTVEVRTADLNLASPEGRAALDRRIDIASRRVCQAPDARSVRGLAKIRTCEEAALASARVQRDLIVARAEARQGQSATAPVATRGLN